MDLLNKFNYAVQKNNIEFVKKFIKNIPDINKLDEFGESSLYIGSF